MRMFFWTISIWFKFFFRIMAKSSKKIS